MYYGIGVIKTKKNNKKTRIFLAIIIFVIFVSASTIGGILYINSGGMLQWSYDAGKKAYTSDIEESYNSVRFAFLEVDIPDHVFNFSDIILEDDVIHNTTSITILVYVNNTDTIVAQELQIALDSMSDELKIWTTTFSVYFPEDKLEMRLYDGETGKTSFAGIWDLNPNESLRFLLKVTFHENGLYLDNSIFHCSFSIRYGREYWSELNPFDNIKTIGPIGLQVKT